jgi:hypothetical protein
MADIIPPSTAKGRLAARMSDLIGAPVTTVARVNIVWLDTLRVLSVLATGGAIVHQRLYGDSLWIVWITLASATTLLHLAWVGLRHLGRPLSLGVNGGVVAVSGPTLYIAGNNWITGRPTNILEALCCTVQAIELHSRWGGGPEGSRNRSSRRRRDDASRRADGPEQPSEARGSGPDGSRTLLTRFSKWLMARDFWQQGFEIEQFRDVGWSTGVLASPRESSPVVETGWRRHPSLKQVHEPAVRQQC